MIHTLFYGYQVVIDAPSQNDTFTIEDANGNTKQNSFLVNGDQVVVTEQQSTGFGGSMPTKVKFPLNGLNDFSFIPTSLIDIPPKFDASKFKDDQANYTVTNGSDSSTGVSWTTVEATSKIPGYTVVPLISKFSYITAPVTMAQVGDISEEPGKSINVGFQSSWSNAVYGEAFNHIGATITSSGPNDTANTVASHFNAPMTISKITIAEPFKDSGATSFQYQEREIKSYIITVKDADGKTINTINVPNANLSNVIFNEISGSLVENIFEFVGSAAAIAIPGLGELAVGETAIAAGIETAIAFGLTTGLPALTDLIVGFANGHPDMAFMALGYEPKDLSEAEKQLGLVYQIMGAAAGMGRDLKNLFTAESALKALTNGATVIWGENDIAKTVAELASKDLSHDDLEVLVRSFSDYTQNTPNKFEFWNSLVKSVKAYKTQIDNIKKFGVSISFANGIEVPKGGSLQIDVEGANKVGAAFHTTLFHWWSHSWGTFEVNEDAQIIIEGNANDVVFANPTK